MRGKILYLYAGFNRKKMLEIVNKNLSPDSSFFGLINLKKIYSGKVDFLEMGQAFSYKVEFFVRRYLSFNLIHIFLFFKVRKYDFIISSVALPLLFLKSFFLLKKSKWIIFNIHLTNLLKRNKQKKIKYNLILQAVKKADRIICLSNSQIDFLANLGIDRKKLSFIPFGVDNIFFKYSNRDDGYILSVGRDNGRNYKPLIEAARGVKENFIIITSERNMKNIKDIPDNVKVFYDLEYEEVRRYYEGAKMVVVSSTNENILDGSDCSGQMTILDAMACGKAVVATYRSWMNDYFKNKEDIIIVDSEDSFKLKEGINILLADADLRKEIGRKARENIDNRLNSKIMAQKISNLIKEDLSCKVCGSSNIKQKYRIEDLIYYKCHNCSLVFLKNKFDKKELEEIYNKEEYFRDSYKKQSTDDFDYFSNKEEKVLLANNKINELVAFDSIDFGINKNILDIGCAAGFFLKAAKQRGLKVFGVEISKESASFAKKEFDIDIIAKDILELGEEYNNFFDIISMFHVLEHLPDINEQMQKIYKLLKPGGVLIIEVPNIKSVDNLLYKNLIRTLQPPHHLYAFSPESLKELSIANNFKVIEQKVYFSSTIGSIILKFISFFGLKKSNIAASNKSNINNNKTSVNTNFLSTIKNLVKKVFPGSNMLIICKK